MKTYIPQLLEKTPEQLQEIKEQLFFNIALKFSYNNVDAQYLVTNQKLCNWFYAQVTLLESEFIQSLANSSIIKKSQFELFCFYLLKIEKVKHLHPRGILNDIRKIKRNKAYDYSKTCLN